MKKTLITLAALAMASVASAASAVTPVDPTAGDFSTDNAYTLTLVLNWDFVMNLGNINAKSSVLATTHPDQHYWYRNGIKIWRGGDEVSPTLFTQVCLDNDYTPDNVPSDDAPESGYMGFKSDDAYNGKIALTYTFTPGDWDSETGTRSSILTLYVTKSDKEGGLEHYTVTKSVSNAWANLGKDGYEFDTLDTIVPEGIVDQLYVFNTALTSDEAVAFATSVIPEPATATLSLLALAGFAARRRRK